MILKLGQNVKYKKVVRKIETRYLEKSDFDENELVKVDRIKMVEFKNERRGIIIGVRNIAKKAEYIFNDDNPNIYGHVEHFRTETIKVYKVAYDMAHTNYVLEKDLIQRI